MTPPATEPVSSTYHVFINHRGPDVKKTLASLIYHRLRSCGLRVFLDQKELHAGDALSPAILGAIQSASLHIAIFSKRYAESRWCLDELCWILDCNRKIVPVFWDVEPADLRHIDRDKGSYKEAFKKHQDEGRVVKEDIEKWKTALKKAAEISGLPFKTNESDLGKVVEIIVKQVLKEVNWEPLEVAAYPSGLEQAAEELNNEIKKQNELNGTAIVGIAGMAGLGKSTLATYLYNSKRSDFSRSCFLSDIRKKDSPSLQRKLLRDLLGCDFHIEDTRQGKGFIRERLRGLQVLIALDDADHIEQINNLLVTDVVGSRSLILITSRDQDVLRRSSPKTVVYNVRPLQRKHAHELFCWHAFHQPEPCEGFEHLVEEALEVCRGLPLSLQVLGGQFLGRREKEYWKQQLEKLSRELPDDIMDRLKVSYEALRGVYRDIFLDLGCFFPGEDKELAVRVFEGLGYTDVGVRLEDLRQKCLIEFHDDVQSDEEPIDGFIRSNLSLQMTRHDSNDDYDYLYLPKINKITMHDHIRHLARHIAREEFGVPPPSKPLRFSCSNDIEEFMKLQGGANSCLIRGIRTPKGQNLPDCTNYIKGVGVRLIVVEVPIDLSSLFGLWPMSGDLVWLRLRSFSSINFPDISLGNLRVLELEGHGDLEDLEQLFQRFNMPPLNLSVLNINVRGTHPSTSSSSRSLDLKGFTASYFFRFLEWIGTGINVPSKIVLKNITSLQSLPIAFRELKNLRHLDLSGCINLTQMPNSFSELMHLQYLALRDCINLSIPSDILGEMSALEYVDFKGCCKLVYLPMGIANQRSLKYLNLLGTHLKWPLNIKLPEKLQRLRIGNLGADRSHVPQHHHHLGNLRPLKELEELILIDFNSAGQIWEKIAGPNMKILVIRDCPISIFSFKKQGTMLVGSVLRDLILSGTQITWICIPGGVLPSLEILDLSRNRRLVQVKGLPSTLIRLNLQGCVKLKALINFSNLVNLKFLCINGCGELETLNVEGLMSLEEIQAEECWELKSIEGLPSTLIRLDLQGCYQLKASINLSNLVDLKFLCISRCGELETLNVEGLMSLEEIQAEECRELKSIEGLSQRERLKYLRISTNTDVIWNDICNVLTSPSHEKLSTAFFSGKSKNTEMVMPEMQSIREQFNLKVVDVVFPATPDGRFEFHTKMEDLQSYGAILMCFLTGCVAPGEFRVRFEASDDGRSADEYTIRRGYSFSGEPKVHVFMWTEECNLFRDDKCYNNIAVYYNDISGMVDVEKGWIMMVDKKIDVSEVCKQFIIAFS